ncbi:carbonic anhydrase [Roseomonas sp. 18066]|uniref:carbonic anhydrase n=1 Tax=Roseomonas sp. 18066 TaxID=2681412 RepID=UPI001359B6F1|nr:carbonic anhydrase [Roseomonas sp. 18066]
MFSRLCRCGDGSQPPRPGRRALVASALALAAAPLTVTPRAARASGGVPHSLLTPDQALALLKEGNDEFRVETPYHAALGRERRVELAGGQAPFCVLVGCSDSRVPPELLFGRGLGELFIVRNAGNTVDTAALGSIEYGVAVLGCPLVVVLGHENCGAVAAALEVVQANARFPGVIGEMVQPILPAVLAARQGSGAVTLDDAVVANARRVARRLKTQSTVIQGLVEQGRLKVVAARYDLDDGDVIWLEDL